MAQFLYFWVSIVAGLLFIAGVVYNGVTDSEGPVRRFLRWAKANAIDRLTAYKKLAAANERIAELEAVVRLKGQRIEEPEEANAAPRDPVALSRQLSELGVVTSLASAPMVQRLPPVPGRDGSDRLALNLHRFAQQAILSPPTPTEMPSGRLRAPTQRDIPDRPHGNPLL